MMLPASYHTGFAPRDGYPAYPELWRGCVGAWAACLGPTGLTLRDWSGRQNHGTLTNMVPGDDWVVSGGRYVLDFDASNDYIDLPLFPVISPPFTVMASVLAASTTGNSVVIAYRSTSDANPIVFQLSRGGGNYEFIVRNNAGTITAITSASVVTGVWVHLAAMQIGTDMRLFLNGRQVASGTAPTGSTTVNSMNIGATVAGAGAIRSSFWNGQIAEVSLFNRGLHENEIATAASRRGIAYEMYRPTYYTPPISARRRKILTGQV